MTELLKDREREMKTGIEGAFCASSLPQERMDASSHITGAGRGVSKLFVLTVLNAIPVVSTP
jgi:hypothetical protein